MRKHIVRAIFDISARVTHARIQNLEEGDREKYNEKVYNSGDTLIWINVEFLNKANDLLHLDKYFSETELQSINLQCF